MRKQRIDGQDTRRRLLQAASEIFADKGFQRSTIAGICRRAGANVAAANYHFGGKENLYVEAWRFAFQKSLDAHPPDGGVPSDAPAEERLRGTISSIMRRITDPESHDLDIMHKEIANPTGLLHEARKDAMEP